MQTLPSLASAMCLALACGACARVGGKPAVAVGNASAAASTTSADSAGNANSPSCAAPASIPTWCEGECGADETHHPLAFAAAHGLAAAPAYDASRQVVRFTFGNADLSNSPLAFWSLQLVEVSATSGDVVRTGLITMPGVTPPGQGDSADEWRSGQAMTADWAAACGEPLRMHFDLGALALGRVHREAIDLLVRLDAPAPPARRNKTETEIETESDAGPMSPTLRVSRTEGGKRVDFALATQQGHFAASFGVDEPDCSDGTLLPLALYQVPSTGQFFASVLAYGKHACFMDAQIFRPLLPVSREAD